MRKQDRPLTRHERLWFASTLVWVTLLVLLVSCSACAGKQYPDHVPTMSDPAVVKLIRISEGEVAGYCTAWKLDDNRVMTAGHCCTTEEGTTYTVEGAHTIPGQSLTVIYDNNQQDVCVMKGKIRGAPIRFADYDPTIGEMVWTAGFPKTHFLISAGYWSGRDDEGKAVASIAVWGGASGSPAMNSRGEAVGILVAYYPPISNMAFLTPLEWMRDAEVATRLNTAVGN